MATAVYPLNVCISLILLLIINFIFFLGGQNDDEYDEWQVSDSYEITLFFLKWNSRNYGSLS